MKTTDDLPRYQPLPRRRRLLLLGVAAATACVVIWLMLRPQLRLMRARHDAAARGAAAPAAAPVACAAQQTEGCVGGTMGVIVAPLPPASR